MFTVYIITLKLNNVNTYYAINITKRKLYRGESYISMCDFTVRQSLNRLFLY